MKDSWGVVKYKKLVFVIFMSPPLWINQSEYLYRNAEEFEFYELLTVTYKLTICN